MKKELNSYELELEALGDTYALAMAADIKKLKNAIASASESSIIGVGSGGSYTSASLLCALHEAYTGRVSRPSTPLEIISNPTLASTSPVFLISAEGKNPDAIEALVRARQHSSRAIHLLTNRSSSPLIEKALALTDINCHSFDLTQKDGYLATNSLLMDCVLIARAYGELDESSGSLLPERLENLGLGGKNIENWLADTDEFIRESVSRKNIIVTYSPLLQPIAIDFESKLSEAALLFSQFSDIRSFAHGRHLWLAERAEDCAVLAIVDPLLTELWMYMQSLIPPTIPSFTMRLNGSKPRDLLAGIVAQMHLIAKIARLKQKDPGRPQVLQFSRDLYYTNLPDLVPPPKQSSTYAQVSKFEVLGARWPSKLRHGFMERAFKNYKIKLSEQAFRAIVFDYDGTLCSSQRKDAPPPELVLNKIKYLIDSGIVIGIASGRGGSIQEHLRKVLPDKYWSMVWLGLYNAGQIVSVEQDMRSSDQTSEFLNHTIRIVNQLKQLGVPVDTIKTTHPYQVSIRFREGISTEYMWIVVADALRQAGLDNMRVVASKHSIDILSYDVSKSKLIAHIIQKCKIEPYQILTIGDQGAWPGNDSALLEHRFSLSVDIPSRQIDRGWNLAPPHKRGVDATLWYLECINVVGQDEFKLTLNSLPIE